MAEVTDSTKKEPESLPEGEAMDIDIGVSAFVNFQIALPDGRKVEIPSVYLGESFGILRQSLLEYLETTSFTSYRLVLLRLVDGDGKEFELPSTGTGQEDIICNEFMEISQLVPVGVQTATLVLVPEDYDVKRVLAQVKRANDIISRPPVLRGEVRPQGREIKTSSQSDGKTSDRRLSRGESSSESKAAAAAAAAAIATAKAEDPATEDDESKAKLPSIEAFLQPLSVGSFYYDTLYRTGKVENDKMARRAALLQLVTSSIKSVFVSGWNPVPPHRRCRGDLLYLEVVTANEGTLHITAVPSGFFVNKSNRYHFDASPHATAPCFAHLLFDTLLAASPTLRRAWKALKAAAAEDRALSLSSISDAGAGEGNEKKGKNNRSRGNSTGSTSSKSNAVTTNPARDDGADSPPLAEGAEADPQGASVGAGSVDAAGGAEAEGESPSLALDSLAFNYAHLCGRDMSVRAQWNAYPEGGVASLQEETDAMLQVHPAAMTAAAVTGKDDKDAEPASRVTARVLEQETKHALSVADSVASKPGSSSSSSSMGTGATGAASVTASEEYDLFKAQTMLSSLHGMEELGAAREWNDEIQAIRGLEAPDLDSKVHKIRMEHKVVTEFSEACKAGVMAIVDGLITPLNMGDTEGSSPIYLYNNIFFSSVVDTKDNFKLCNGDDAYYKVAGRDFQNQKVIRAYEIDGLHCLLGTIVDYKGQRYQGNSLLPGILPQGENKATLMYGVLDRGKVLTVKHSSLAQMKALCDRLCIPERNLKLVPFEELPADVTTMSTISEGGDEWVKVDKIEGARVAGSGGASTVPGLNSVQNMIAAAEGGQEVSQVKVDEVDNIVLLGGHDDDEEKAVEEGGVVAATGAVEGCTGASAVAAKAKKEKSTPHCGAVETKILRGTDGRNYIIEAMRLAPRDANYVKGSKGTGRIPQQLLERTDDDLNKVAVLRQELTALFIQKKMSEARQKLIAECRAEEEQQRKEKGKAAGAPSAGATKDDEASGEKGAAAAAVTAAATEGKDRLDDGEEGDVKIHKEDSTTGPTLEKQQQLDEEEMSRLAQLYTDKFKSVTEQSLGLEINPNCFMGFDFDVDPAVVEKDEALAREMAEFLWDSVLPTLTQKVREGDVMPVDSASMVEKLHRMGVNMRYLGPLCTLAAEQEREDALIVAEGKQRIRSMPPFWREMLTVELLARCTKHILNGYLKANPAVASAPAQTVASVLNHLMSLVQTKSADEETEDAKNSATTGAAGAGSAHSKGKKKKGAKGSAAAGTSTGVDPAAEAAAAAAAAAFLQQSEAAAAAASSATASSKKSNKKKKKNGNGGAEFASSVVPCGQFGSDPDAAASRSEFLENLVATAARRFCFDLQPLLETTETGSSSNSSNSSSSANEQGQGATAKEGRGDSKQEGEKKKKEEQEQKQGDKLAAQELRLLFQSRISPAMLLRRVCQICGVRVATKPYNLPHPLTAASSSASSYVSPAVGLSPSPQVFSAADVVELLPVVKSCDNEGLLPEFDDMLRTASMYLQQGQQSMAFEMAQQAASIATQVVGPYHVRTLRAMETLVGVLLSAGDLVGAAQMTAKVLAVSANLHGLDSEHAYIHHLRMAIIYSELPGTHHVEIAAQHVLTAHYLVRLMAGDRHVELGTVYSHMARLFDRNRNFEAAMQCLMLARSYVADMFRLCQLHITMAELCYRNESLGQALELQKTAYRVLKQLLPENDQRLEEVKRGLELYLRAVDEYKTHAIETMRAQMLQEREQLQQQKQQKGGKLGAADEGAAAVAAGVKPFTEEDLEKLSLEDKSAKGGKGGKWPKKGGNKGKK